MVATGAFLQYYWTRRNIIKIPPTIREEVKNSAYGNSLKKRMRVKKSFNNVEIAQLTAVYYALIEEVDFWVGELLDAVEASGLSEDTLIVFTSDHVRFVLQSLIRFEMMRFMRK